MKTNLEELKVRMRPGVLINILRNGMPQTGDFKRIFDLYTGTYSQESPYVAMHITLNDPKDKGKLRHSLYYSSDKQIILLEDCRENIVTCYGVFKRSSREE